MTKLETLTALVPDSREKLDSFTLEDCKEILKIGEELSASRYRWIEEAVLWQSFAMDIQPDCPKTMPSLHDLNRAAVWKIKEILDRKDRATLNTLIDEATSVLNSLVHTKIREAGEFWSFHLSFIHTAIKAGRPMVSVVEKISELMESMTGK